MVSSTIDEDREILLSFISESQEMFEEIELNLVQLQEVVEKSGDPDDEIINSIFRLFHSVKGSAGFLNLHNIAKVTHEAETLLDLVRQGEVKLETSHTDLLIRAYDLTQNILGTIESSFEEGHDAEVSTLIEEFVAAETQADASESDSSDELQLTITPEMVKQFIQESDEI
ncbi:MAG: Hpt domain-containing protein, partial [Desulfobulbaceae bacterium]|nr:Hpt domain-containing protein [Desulfobulbaceae bacterium]